MSEINAELGKEKLAKLTVERVLRNAHQSFRNANRCKGVPLWSFVADLTQHGSGYSIAICLALGWNPDAKASDPLIENPINQPDK